MHSGDTACIRGTLHAFGGHCMHSGNTACIRGTLHAFGGRCMHSGNTAPFFVTARDVDINTETTNMYLETYI